MPRVTIRITSITIVAFIAAIALVPSVAAAGETPMAKEVSLARDNAIGSNAAVAVDFSINRDLATAANFAAQSEVALAGATILDEDERSWWVLCAACVGFALGAGVFALPALLAFLATPAGVQSASACLLVCLGAVSEV